MLETDPSSSHVDARKNISLPDIIGVSPSQVVFPNQILNITETFHQLKFQFNQSIDVLPRSCDIRVEVTGSTINILKFLNDI